MSGVFFETGEGPFTARDLSSFRGISFMARGDNVSVTLKLWSYDSVPWGPVEVSVAWHSTKFVASPAWTRHEFSFADLGLDGHDIGYVVLHSEQAGAEFQLDDVRLFK
jgi:hypothetical protein